MTRFICLDGAARPRTISASSERQSLGLRRVAESVELLTERLRLRTPRLDDAPAIQSIAADRRVALTTASIPHRYPEGGAAHFITHVLDVANRERRNLAIVLRDSGELIGMIGYELKGSEAELAYMVSPNHWGLGYATEACKKIVAHIFE